MAAALCYRPQYWLVVPLSCPAACALQLKSFVHRDGGQLKLEGNPFYFLGFNAYWLADYGYEVSTGGLQWLRSG